MEDSVDIIDMFPDESMDQRVSRDGLIPTILSLIAGLWSFDSRIIHEGLRGVRYLWLKDKCDVSMKYQNVPGPSLRYGC